MSYNIKFEDNSPKFKSEWGSRKKKITYAIGLKWQSICQLLITKKVYTIKPSEAYRKLTGRLRGSLTFITNNKVGKPTKTVSENTSKDYLSGSSGNDGDLIVGSNLIYAQKIELSARGGFVKESILNYREDYKNIAKSIMNE